MELSERPYAKNRLNTLKSKRQRKISGFDVNLMEFLNSRADVSPVDAQKHLEISDRMLFRRIKSLQKHNLVTVSNGDNDIVLGLTDEGRNVVEVLNNESLSSFVAK